MTSDPTRCEHGSVDAHFTNDLTVGGYCSGPATPPMTLGWLASPDDELVPAKSRPLPYADDDTIGGPALVLPEESTPE